MLEFQVFVGVRGFGESSRRVTRLHELFRTYFADLRHRNAFWYPDGQPSVEGIRVTVSNENHAKYGM